MWINIMIALLFAIGLAFLLSNLFRIPTYAVSKAANGLGKRKNRTNPLELFLREVSGWLAGKLRLNEYRRIALEDDLRTADMNISPEGYVADCIVKSAIVGIFAVPVFFFSRITAVLIIIVAILLYRHLSAKVGRAIKERRAKIEAELPRFVSVVANTLSHSRDVLSILDGYRERAGTEFRRELDITVADMRSGHDLEALRRMGNRIGSAKADEVIRELQSVIRGNSTASRWEDLSRKFGEYQRQALRDWANQTPKKVRRLSMILLVCFVLIYIAVIGQVLVSSLGGIFG